MYSNRVIQSTQGPNIVRGRNEPTASSSLPSGHDDFAGSIAGGVIGGVYLSIHLTFLVWRFAIRRKLHPEDYLMDDWSDQAENGDDDLRAQRDTPSSMHPVGSIATTTVTRAPNTISVGYMAGINARPLPAIPEDRTTIDFVHSVASDVSADTRHYMPDDISGDEILPSIPAIPPSSTSLTPAQQELHHHISIATEISQVRDVRYT